MLQNLLTWWPAQAAQYLICVFVLILDCVSQDASKHHCIQPHQILFVCLHVFGFPPQVSSLSSVTVFCFFTTTLIFVFDFYYDPDFFEF